MDDALADDDWDAEADDDDEAEPTAPCPCCRRQIHEDAQRCPHCERYISAEDAPRDRKPWWIVATVVLCLYLVYRWMRLLP